MFLFCEYRSAVDFFCFVFVVATLELLTIVLKM